MGNREIVSQGSCFSALSAQAWNSLKGKRLICLGVILFVSIIQSLLNSYFPKFSALVNLLLSPLNAGILLFFLHVIRDDSTPKFSFLFEPCNQYFRYIWASLRIFIFVFLWTLLLIIPGIVAAFRYSMTIYVMLDNPQFTVKEAMTESCAIMYGHKWKLFGYVLLIGFLIMLAGICTTVIVISLPEALIFLVAFWIVFGLVWLLPWLVAFNTAFYDSVRRKPEEPAPLQETEPAKIPD